jgi:lipopolysaccharide transport system permease protein
MISNELREFWDYRELFFFLAWRDIKIRYRQTVLGAAWAVIQPTVTMIVFTVLFGTFAQLPTDGIPHAIFYYSALLPWTYFSANVSYSANSLVGNSNLLTKVYMPRAILPASAILGGLVDFAIGFVVLLGIMAYYRIQPGWALLLWPIFTLPLVAVSLGVGMFLAALNVRYRDIKYAIPFAMQLWLFMTPIIYPASMIPERFRFLMALNPLAGIIAAFRSSVLADPHVDWRLLAFSTIFGLLTLFLGFRYFKSTERTFADII